MLGRLQKQIVRLVDNNGYITANQASRIYGSSTKGKQAIQQFLALGYLEKTEREALFKPGDHFKEAKMEAGYDVNSDYEVEKD